MSEVKPTVHIAGAYADRLQFCTRCGAAITDNRRKFDLLTSEPWETRWGEGKRVADYGDGRMSITDQPANCKRSRSSLVR